MRAKLSSETTGPKPGPGKGTERLRAAALAAGALAALLAACASKPPPPPDTDATPETARSLALSAPHLDALQCEDETGPDCVDWFRFRPTGPGTLKVLVAMHVAEGAKPPATTPPFELAVTDEAGADLGRATTTAETPIATVSLDVREPKAYLASVRLPSGGEREAYRLGFEAQLRTAPPPATKSRRWTVLEVDRGAAGTSVLIDGGRADALAPGQRGRLVEGSRTLGRVVVVEVFEEGARARVEGALSGTITAETVAEIEVPADTR